jgi:phage recombination protein Bet
MNQKTNIKPAEQQRIAGVEIETIRLLQDSLYPGAKPESIAMVVNYCRAAGLNHMLKPVHIVPMSVKVPGQNGQRDQYVWRDVIMPGVAHYRMQASRSGHYLGKSEPEYGPDVTMKLGGVEVTYPSWCRVTVRRAVGSFVAEFTALERWTENYATAGKDTQAPNAMWRKRPYGQLAKVAEAQALRMAFPELLGGETTAEEMEGKSIEDTIDLQASVSKSQTKQISATARLDTFSGAEREKVKTENPDVIDGTVTKVKEENDAGATGEDKMPAIPAMPADAAELWAGGKWMRGWKWFQAAIGEVQPSIRQALWDENRDMLNAVAAYNEEAKLAVASLAKQYEVKTDEYAAD